MSTPHSNCQFLILGKFAEATKILIISNDQTCHLCNGVFDILHSWSYRFELGLSCYAIKFGKNLFSEDIWDNENFTFLIQLFEMVLATTYIKCVESPVLVACQWSRMLTWFPIISILFFSLAPYFTCNNSDPVRIWSNVSRSCTAGYPGWPVLFWVP